MVGIYFQVPEHFHNKSFISEIHFISWKRHASTIVDDGFK